MSRTTVKERLDQDLHDYWAGKWHGDPGWHPSEVTMHSQNVAQLGMDILLAAGEGPILAGDERVRRHVAGVRIDRYMSPASGRPVKVAVDNSLPLNMFRFDFEEKA